MNAAVPAPRVGVLEAPPDDEKRDEAEVRLRLAAAGRKPYEVQHIPVVVVFPDGGLHDGKQERELKGTPTVAPGLGLPAGNAVRLAHLVEHRPVREPERLGREWIGAKHLDTPLHAFDGDTHPAADASRRRPFPGHRQPGGEAPLLLDPVGIAVDEAGESARCVRGGEAGRIEHRVVAVGIEGHLRHLGLGHKVGPDTGCPTRRHVPARGRAVAEGVDALFPVLKLELLLLLGQQARIDARILDELAALDHAFEPRLEQGLHRPVAGPPGGRRFRVQLTSIAQGDGEDEPAPMRPRADIDAGAPLPDLMAQAAGRRGARPTHGLFREPSPDVLANPKPPFLLPLPGVLVDGCGSGDRQPHVSANEAGEADRRRRNIPTPTGRLGERAILRSPIRRRRLFRVVEEHRLRFLMSCRRGIDAGEPRVDGMQHPRRVSIQRGHPEAPLLGRPDELVAQPGDELLSAFDVHRSRFNRGRRGAARMNARYPESTVRSPAKAGDVPLYPNCGHERADAPGSGQIATSVREKSVPLNTSGSSKAFASA